MWCDRDESRTLAIRARIELALRNALGGQSLISVEVGRARLYRRGHVLLCVPAGWDCLIRDAWDQILGSLPPKHDLVIRCQHPADRSLTDQAVGSSRTLTCRL